MEPATVKSFLTFLEREGRPVEYRWGGFTSRSFPPVQVDDQVVVLTRYLRTGRGHLVWYRVLENNGRLLVPFALQFLE